MRITKNDSQKRDTKTSLQLGLDKLRTLNAKDASHVVGGGSSSLDNPCW